MRNINTPFPSIRKASLEMNVGREKEEERMKKEGEKEEEVKMGGRK